MLTEEKAKTIANHWIKSWNAHDLDAIMSHYEDDIVLVSPIAAKILVVECGNKAGVEL